MGRDWSPDELSRFSYWSKRVAAKDHPASVRVDGTQYILKADRDHLPGFPGHGGRDFYIRFDDGRLVHTTNLWLNGEIPPEFKAQLPDNARFMDRAEFERLVAEKVAGVGQPPSPSEIAREAASGVYQVWLNYNTPENRIVEMFGGPAPAFPEGFRHVANVQAASVEDAFQRTRASDDLFSPDDDAWKAWQKNEGVEPLVDDVRGADFADVIVDPAGHAHQLVNGGFRRIAYEQGQFAGRGSGNGQTPAAPTPYDIAKEPSSHASEPERGHDPGRGRR